MALRSIGRLLLTNIAVDVAPAMYCNWMVSMINLHRSGMDDLDDGYEEYRLQVQESLNSF
jgi:hypothetical protein